MLLVNPVRDGLNLVAKEGALLNRNDGVLALSREAGVWDELGGTALEVNPFDVAGTSDVLSTALAMAPAERAAHAAALRKAAEARVPRDWLDDQLALVARSGRTRPAGRRGRATGGGASARARSRLRTPSGPSTTMSARSSSSAGDSGLRTATRAAVTPVVRRQPVEGVERLEVAPVVADEQHVGEPGRPTAASTRPLSWGRGGRSSNDIRAGWTASPERAAASAVHAPGQVGVAGGDAEVDGHRQVLALDAEGGGQLGLGPGRHLLDDAAPGLGRRHRAHPVGRHHLQPVEAGEGHAPAPQVLGQEGARAAGDHAHPGVAPGQGLQRVGRPGEGPGRGGVVDDGGQGAVEVGEHPGRPGVGGEVGDHAGDRITPCGRSRGMRAEGHAGIFAAVPLPSVPVIACPPCWSSPARVVLSPVALASRCSSEDKVQVAFRPKVGDTFRYELKVRSVTETRLGTAAPERTVDEAVLEATDTVLEAGPEEVRVQVVLRRSGSPDRSFVVRFDRAAQLSGVETVEGLPPGVLGPLAFPEFLPAAAAAPPNRMLSPGREVEDRLPARPPGRGGGPLRGHRAAGEGGVVGRPQGGVAAVRDPPAAGELEPGGGHHRGPRGGGDHHRVRHPGAVRRVGAEGVVADQGRLPGHPHRSRRRRRGPGDGHHDGRGALGDPPPVVARACPAAAAARRRGWRWWSSRWSPSCGPRRRPGGR